MAHGIVFCGDGNDVSPLRENLHGGKDGGVVSFRATAGEDDFTGLTIQQRSHLLPRMSQRTLHMPGRAGTAAGIGEVLLPEGFHGFLHARIQWRWWRCYPGKS